MPRTSRTPRPYGRFRQSTADPGGAIGTQVDPLVGFDDFYRGHYRTLLKAVMAVGATLDEAYEAVDQTMEEVLLRWPDLTAPLRYARRAVFSNFVKRRSRERQRLPRTIQGGHLNHERSEDPRLSTWEDAQWVHQLLSRLPPAQREVMAHVVDGLAPAEIAALLGKSPATVQQNLRLARTRLARILLDVAHPAAETLGKEGPDER